MPMVLDTSRRPRAIRFAGANFGDRFVPAARESDEAEVAAAVMGALQEEGLDRYMLLLDHVDQDRPWWREMQQASSVRRAAIEQQQYDVAYIQLEGLDWEGYLASRSRNFRSQVRRRERALERDHEVKVQSATEATLQGDLLRLFDLHARRWQARGRSSLEASGAKESLSSFAELAQQRGWLRLRLLEVDGVAVAGFLGWRLGDSYAFYQSGFDPSWSDKSVGVVMMATTVRSAIEEGAIEFDMLLGDEPYKQRFTNASRPVQTVILTRSTSPTRLLVAGEARARRYGRSLVERPGIGAAARALQRLLPTSRGA
jgi:CelD/BcsL family acetyltransferase involved in cellulose biosynthesis